MMEAQIETLKKRLKTAFLPEDDAVIRQTRSELQEYFAGNRQEFSIPLDYPGTPFENESVERTPQDPLWRNPQL